MKSRTQIRKKIEPSTRDSISTWLDVLTAMLVMPDTQRLQVRDELEDHLRSRVDDLLIMGKSEPEAIRIAVAELGETAELAKLITHAHTKSNPRRKIMNAALITVALAGMSFGGFSFINGTGAPSATPSNGGAVPVVVPQETKRDDAKTHVFEYDSYISMYTMLNDIAVAFDMTLEMSRESGQSPMDSYLGHHKANIEGEMTFKQAIAHFEAQFSSIFIGYQLLIGDQAIQFMSEDEYQRSLIVTRVYTYPKWLSTNDRITYPGSLTKLIEVKHDLQFASIQGVGDSIVVAASPTIHQEIMAYQTQLEIVLAEQRELINQRNIQSEEARTKRDEERMQRSVQREHKKEAERLQAIKRIQTEFNRVRTELVQKKIMINELQSKLRVLNNAFDPELSTRRNDREKSEIEKAFADTELLYEEYESRYNYLRDTLIESEYTALFEGLE